MKGIPLKTDDKSWANRTLVNWMLKLQKKQIFFPSVQFGMRLPPTGDELPNKFTLFTAT